MGSKHPDLSHLAPQLPTSASYFPKLTGSLQAQLSGNIRKGTPREEGVVVRVGGHRVRGPDTRDFGVFVFS